MGVQALLGRCLFALIFLSSALNKVRLRRRSSRHDSAREAGRVSRRVAAGQDVWQRRRPRGGVRRAEAGRLQGAHRERLWRFAGRAAHRGVLRAQRGEGFRALAFTPLLPRRRLAVALWFALTCH